MRTQSSPAILKEVHGGNPGPMFRSRIVEQMCREPDEESSFYSDIACGDMGVMIYNLPGGSRLRHRASVIGRCCGLEDHPGKHGVRC